jgi:hypothetical protein
VKILSVFLILSLIVIIALSVTTHKFRFKARAFESILEGQDKDFEELFNIFMERYGRHYSSEEE